MKRAKNPFPQTRVLRNTTSLLDSAVEAVAAGGASELSFRSVARRAGLSPQALRSRYADVSALTVGIWEERLSSVLGAVLQRLVDVADYPDTDSSKMELAEIFSSLMKPESALKAASDLLIVSQFQPALQDAVEHSLGREVARVIRPSTGKLSAAAAARRAYLIIAGLGLLLGSRHPGSVRLEMSSGLDPLIEALRRPGKPRALPEVPGDHFRTSLDFESGDPLGDAILTSTLEEVADRGFDRTTTNRIAANAGCTEGAIFSRYDSKLELFNEANRRQAEAAFGLNQAYLEGMIADHGLGVAETVYMKEQQLPKYRSLRALHLESLRVTWYEPKVMEANAREVDAAFEKYQPQRSPAQRHLDYSINLGVSALPLLDSRCWSLPYDVVLIPFMDLLP